MSTASQQPQTEAPNPATAAEATAAMRDEAKKYVEGVDLAALLAKAVENTAKRVIPDPPAVQQFKIHKAKAELFAESGYFQSSGNVNQAIAGAFTKIEIGASMGFTEAQSMMGISIVGNRPTIEAQLRGTRMQELGYSWETEWFEDGDKTTGCRLWLYKDGKPVMRPKRNRKTGEIERDAAGKPIETQISEKFDIGDAERIKVYEKGNVISLAERAFYTNFPRNMFFARALTNLQRFQVPKALNGVNIPSREEATDAVDAAETGQLAAQTNGSKEAADSVIAAKLENLKHDTTTNKESAGVQQASTDAGKDDSPAGERNDVKSPTPAAAAPRNDVTEADPETLFGKDTASKETKRGPQRKGWDQ